ncbi:hypothetical protein COCSUDRAFT_59757 [Coccomyxa subellipsoidea C-169]|uniref:tRNA/rRNA methyltransferase SpoU type domain-containing protein n=1 Tax=Coccomyxa subellipsoidea (strain C-169) TaxID=574566 RepID=I0YKA7_COCSC|nr:hypothetical protein COCSUDRAFT_59757 [Coccomyxa subellipsoidea C-169]EIE18826.1 hypothetical protein COCSUDRAFT_59757 [Coccomyxa subellipsoidea C-169]|eukprot:XP_005643370.1 hypothetical protein COCSUDRAFT_59757 [Coccomyxa subellipsoidea C-169]
MFHETIRSLVQAGVLLAAGAFANNLGSLEKIDAQLGLKFAAYVTLPALALQLLSVPGVAGIQALTIVSVSAAFSAFLALLGWLVHGKRRGPERALLTGSAVGVALGTFGLPFVEAAFGTAGVRIALLWDLANVVAVCGLAYLVFASGGSPPPALYEHADGGTYRGQWRGNKKQGLGVYVYPGGGRYEGMWRDNVKHGYGVYAFPKGGLYEGEWVAGEREGMGARLMRNGSIKAGRWGTAKLEKQMDPLDCAYAVNAAQRAAQAARRVKVGGGKVEDVLMNLAMQPFVWASAAALWLSYSGSPLPALVDAVSGTLASAHLPLVLLCSGALLAAPHPKVLQVKDTAAVLLTRYVSPLLLAAAAALVSPSHSLLAAVAAICALSPAPYALVDYAREARLNDSFAAALAPLSSMTSAILMALLALLVSSQVPPPLTTAEAALPPLVPPVPFAAAAAALAAAVSVAAFLYVRLAGRTRRGSGNNPPRGAVRMTLQATPSQPMPPVTILEPPSQEVTPAQEAASDADVSEGEPAESFVGQLGVDDSAADVSAEPDEAAQQERPGAQRAEAASSAEEATSSNENSGGADQSRGRGRRPGRGMFRDVDEDNPGGLAASAVVRRGFDVGGCEASSSLILEALIPQVLPERLERIQQVASDRCHSILPVVEALGFGAVQCIDSSVERVKSARGNRTSKGAEKWLDVQRTWGTRRCVEYLRDCGYRILVTQPTADSVPIGAIDWTLPTAFILGNEVNGASAEAIELADQAVTVPMAHSFTESFNVSVAAALILSEARRQRLEKLGRCGDLSPEETQTLTAIMLLKHRGGNALSWHPHWKQHAQRIDQQALSYAM